MTRKREPWSRLLRAVAANAPVLPALRPHLQQLLSLIAEDAGQASRRLRHRSVRALRSTRRKNFNAARQKRKDQRI